MSILHLKLRKGVNTIKLQQNPLTVINHIKILRCFVAWCLKNIRENLNDTFIKDSTSVQIPQGYYDFSDLKDFLGSHKITIGKLKDNRITLESEENLNLKNFGSLLGFDKDKSILKNVKYISDFSTSLTNKLKDIHIHCSLVDSDKVFSGSRNGLFLSSTLLVSLSIGTTQPLNGNFAEYDLNNIRIPCKNYSGQDIEFYIESGGVLKDYEIYLTLEVE